MQCKFHIFFPWAYPNIAGTSVCPHPYSMLILRRKEYTAWIGIALRMHCQKQHSEHILWNALWILFEKCNENDSGVCIFRLYSHCFFRNSIPNMFQALHSHCFFQPYILNAITIPAMQLPDNNNYFLPLNNMHYTAHFVCYTCPTFLDSINIRYQIGGCWDRLAEGVLLIIEFSIICKSTQQFPIKERASFSQNVLLHKIRKQSI